MKNIAVLYIVLVISAKVVGQPGPGDVFREYIWTTADFEESEKFLRVGGRLDYRNRPEKFPEGTIRDGYLTLSQKIDLIKAIKAEVQIEKNLCHEGTRGLSIKIGNSQWYEFPESDSIPHPQWNYLHHTYPVISIPLKTVSIDQVMFKFRVDSVQEWNWPQNLIYGVIFRIYYEQDKLKSFPLTVTPLLVDKGSESITLELNGIENDSTISSVTFLGNYLDINYEGDGIYHQWHYNFYRGMRENHLGKSNRSPFQIKWDTGWVPDQPDPVIISALVELQNGLIFFTPSIELNLEEKEGQSVILCKPADQPQKWTTRSSEFNTSLRLPVTPDSVEQYQLVWVSWSPCYANGIYINEYLVYIREEPCYDFKLHRIILDDNRPLKKGLNVVRTGQTPRDRKGNMVHGMDVQWPGIMLLVKLKK